MVKRINLNYENIYKLLPKINSNSTFWMVRTNSGKYYKDFIKYNYIGINLNKIKLNDIYKMNKSQLEKYLMSQYKSSENKRITKRTYNSWSGELRRFALDIKINDYVLIPSKDSQDFAFGKVVNKPYEIDKRTRLTKGPLRKRIPVKFLREFPRSHADPALYKMIYSQPTITNVNSYSKYILRAAFDTYLSNNNIYMTYHIKQTQGINAYSLTDFQSKFLHICSIDKFNKEDVHVRNNVQSPGALQFIIDLANSKSAILFMLMMLISTLLKEDPFLSFEIDVFGIKLKIYNPINNVSNKNNKKTIVVKKNVKNNKKYKELLNIIKESIKILKSMGKSMKELKCKSPKDLKNIFLKSVSSTKKLQNKVNTKDNNKNQ